MTIHEQLEYGSLAGALSLRQEIAGRAARTFQSARQFRAAVVAITVLVSAVQVAAYTEAFPSLAFVGGMMLPLTLVCLGASLLASAHLWLCRQRWECSRVQLAEFIGRAEHYSDARRRSPWY